MNADGLGSNSLGPSSVNAVLNGLPRDVRERMVNSLERVVLRSGQVLEPFGSPVEQVFFPESAVASVTTMQAERQVELGVVGREGMTGITVLLGEETSQTETCVQLPGDAYRIGANNFRALVDAIPPLRTSLLRYVHTFLAQSARTALANGHWNIEERLARRLLLVHDRIDGDKIALTHGSLAGGLGVTRPGVTLALHMLEERGVIRARRSEITILDREALKHMSRGSYGLLEEQHRPAKHS